MAFVCTAAALSACQLHAQARKHVHRLQRRGHQQRLQPPQAAAAAGDDGPGPLSSRDEAERLNKLLQPTKPITGEELRQLVLDKWGVSYDVTLQRRGKNMYLHVMWKFLEQQSFPLTEEEYMAQLDAVCSYLNLWEVADRVRDGIAGSRRHPGYTAGGSARAVSINLDVDVGGMGRSAEWNTF
ncbi:hypothetical protein COHA_000939 [Chlorella ohadii]|uniref:Uncharacterized protein n=1 Tax=Chlorella ohadii TaxID=2649997 RepID=A0AAD5DYR3_9CHLO|nr:hypothetical protein COHA_000939 [Chlorella ohadii]